MTAFIQQLKKPQTKQVANVKVSIPVSDMQVKINRFNALQRISQDIHLRSFA